MIIATFPQGVSNITVHGLHQWDYGRQLEIHADDLPAMVEVHFACLGMNVAVVRTCSAVDGVATATIPDICLEQTAPIVAWVYAINGTEGATIKTLTLPITQRARPEPEPSIPRDNSDAYTDFLTQVNKAVGDLQDGSVTVEKARVAESLEMGGDVSVGHADTADSAIYASYLHDYASPGAPRKIQIGCAGAALTKCRYLAAYEIGEDGLTSTGRIKDIYADNVSVGHAKKADHADMADFAAGATVVAGDKGKVSSNQVTDVSVQGLYIVTVRDPSYNRLVTVALYVVPGMMSEAVFVSGVTAGDNVPVVKHVYYEPSTKVIFCDSSDYMIVSAYMIMTPNT